VLSRDLIVDSGLFDAAFYLDRYEDVAAAGVDPAEHYLRWGAVEGRRPHPFFDGDWYRRQNPDVDWSGTNPLVHYVTIGRAEGRPAQKRWVVYTAIVGCYDDLRPPVVADPSLDYVVFADDQLPQIPKPWIRRKIDQDYGNAVLTSRFIKTHPHILLPGYENSVWVDAAFQLRNMPAESLQAAIGSAAIACFRHPERDCAYDEADAVSRLELDSPQHVALALGQLAAHGFPRHMGLVETGLILRQHHNEAVVRAMEEWWNLIVTASQRDQLSINLVLWKQGLRCGILRGHSRRNPWTFWMGHRPATLDELRRRLALQEQELLNMQVAIEKMQGIEEAERSAQPFIIEDA
jgi:hypothetical protein